jgi:hypothetical protein
MAVYCQLQEKSPPIGHQVWFSPSDGEEYTFPYREFIIMVLQPIVGSWSHFQRFKSINEHSVRHLGRGISPSQGRRTELAWQHKLNKRNRHRTNKLLLYKTTLKPIWTYGIQLWGTASTSNIEILERFQSKVLRMIVDAPWYVPPNSLIGRDLNCPTVKEEIRRYSSHYGDRLHTHPNHLAVNLLRLPDNWRLCRFWATWSAWQILMNSSSL